MDEVCEVSDALMERYLEGEEISHEEIVGRAQGGHQPRQDLPRRLRRARPRNLGTTRLLDAIVEDLPSPVKHGSLQVGEVELTAERGRAAVRLRLQDPRRPVRRPHQPAARLPGRDARRQPGAEHPRPRQGAHRPAARVQRQGGRPRRSEFGPGDIGAVAKLKETRAGDWLAGARRADRDAAPEAARAGDGVRRRAEEPRRRGEGARLAAPPAGGGPDDRPAPRPADRRADRRRALAGARRSDRRPPARPLRRRGHAEAAARPLPARRSAARAPAPRPPQEAVRRARPVRRLPDRDRAAARRRRRRRLRVRGQRSRAA